MADLVSKKDNTPSRRCFVRQMALGSLTMLATPFPAAAQWKAHGARLVHVRRQSLLMGSVASFDVVAATERDGFEAINRAVRVFRALDVRLSMYRADSEVAELARNAGKGPVPISPDTETVLHYALEMSHRTGGRFDVTIEPVMRRWGFRDDPDHVIKPPTDAELRALERRIGYRHLHIEAGTAYLDRPGMALDVGGLASGYALDQAIMAMKQAGVAAGFINLSGDVHSFGVPADGLPWTVRLLDPGTRQPRPEAIVLDGRALSTSGAYENRRHDDAGTSWGHLVMPASAHPIEPVGSVTALHPSAMTSDAWSTAAYVGAHPDAPGLDMITL